MNEKKYLSYLKQYHQWLQSHKVKAKEDLAERENYAKEDAALAILPLYR